VAGSRAYVPGDPISTIDWRATARLSTARARDEFVVRERYAEEAPRVVVICDRSPSMSLYGPPFPWLSKPAAVRSIVELVIASAEARNASIAYLDFAGALARAGEPYWLPPVGRAAGTLIGGRLESEPFDAPDDAVEKGLEFLARFRSELSSGTFVFVISDFLGTEVSVSAWLTAAARRWEVVPVVVQDPIWERSFPLVDSIVLPLAQPGSGEILEVRLTRREVRERCEENEARHEALVSGLASLGLDPVVVSSSDDESIDGTFVDWASRRRAVRMAR
jgi:uncharacterized protein (DUF58 family)